MKAKGSKGKVDSRPQGAPRLVLARRTRPRRFEDLLGQQGIARALAAALRESRTAHAYLFSGPRGVGKTTSARLFAMSLNCSGEGRDGPEPCGQCESCRKAHEGQDVDVLEIDAASNRGIDQIRDLREKVHYRPMRGRFRVYIIDEVHQLTDAAFNALLKTLEEPPPHVVFVLATTQPSKVPDTIRSRCLHFHFRPVPEAVIRKRLGELAKEEGRSVEAGALDAIARRARGSLRDSLSLLDQLLALPEDVLTRAHLDEVTGEPESGLLDDLIEAALAGDRSLLVTRALDALRRGIDAADLLDAALERLRAVLLCGSLGEETEFLRLTPEERQRVAALFHRQSFEKWVQFLDVALEERERLHRLPDADDLVVEHLCYRWLRLVSDAAASSRRAPPRGPTAGAKPNPVPPAGEGKRRARGEAGRSQGAAGRLAGAPIADPPATGGPPAPPLSGESLPASAWPAFVQGLEGRKASLGSLLRAAVQEFRLEPGGIVFETSQPPGFLERRFASADCQEVVRDAMLEAFGRVLAFRFVQVRARQVPQDAPGNEEAPEARSRPGGDPGVSSPESIFGGGVWLDGEGSS